MSLLDTTNDISQNIIIFRKCSAKFHQQVSSTSKDISLKRQKLLFDSRRQASQILEGGGRTRRPKNSGSGGDEDWGSTSRMLGLIHNGPTVFNAYA